MCGICGLVWRPESHGQARRADAIVDRMLTAMQHRGPDGQGKVVEDAFALGHLRLSIIDLENGQQPMQSSDGQLKLSYNGEIYNYQTRRSDLAAKGWAFKTESDTEVLLANYAMSGDTCGAALNGMYAYAIADNRGESPTVHLGIDPVGIKPIYLAEARDAVIFASELRGIIAGLHALGETPEIDRDALSMFLTLGWVPAPQTLLMGVRKLLPGARLEIDQKTANITENAPLRNSFVAEGGLAEVLERSVERQMIADTPLGFFLSGGIDSSLLVAMAHKLGGRPKTFTIGFEGGGQGVGRANEADVARAVSAHFGTEHFEQKVTADTLLAELDTTLVAMDQPIADPACLPLLILSRFAREHVKVCLSGDGGDELFAGYPRHGLAQWKSRWANIPGPIRGAVHSLSSALPDAPSQGWKEKLRKLKVGVELVSSPHYFAGPFSAYQNLLCDGPPQLPNWAYLPAYDGTELMQADMEGQLVGQMLPKTDHITMFASLECRVPLLDLEMIAAARGMSLSQKREGGIGKAPLRNLLSQYLPDEITKRPKHGFRVPLTSWFRDGFVSEIQTRLLDHETPAEGAIDRGQMEKMINAHLDGNAEHSVRIWALLALQSWIDRLGQTGEAV